MPVCAKWKKNASCLKFEQCMYCPFDHPPEGETTTGEEWSKQKDWLQAALDLNLDSMKSMLEV